MEASAPREARGCYNPLGQAIAGSLWNAARVYRYEKQRQIFAGMCAIHKSWAKGLRGRIKEVGGPTKGGNLQRREAWRVRYSVVTRHKMSHGRRRGRAL